MPTYGSSSSEHGRVDQPAPIALVTSTPSDSHTWNLVFLQLLLEEHGYLVRNLGACPPLTTIVAECRAIGPDIVVVSSVNGHGRSEGAEVVSALRSEPTLCDIPIVIGGMLTTGQGDDRDVVGELIRRGYSEVFQGADAVPAFRSFLAALSSCGGQRECELSR